MYHTQLLEYYRDHYTEMPAGNITFNSRKIAYGRLVGMKKTFIKKSGVLDIKFTEDPDNDDLYYVGPIGKSENVRAALDLIKDHAVSRGSFPGK